MWVFPLFEIQVGIEVPFSTQLIWLIYSTVVGCDHLNYAGKVHMRGLVLMGYKTERAVSYPYSSMGF
jgi:hypothetical protein